MNMFIIEYNTKGSLCRVTLVANGNQRICTNHPQSIAESKALLLSSFLYAYLKHRYQAYHRVGLFNQAAEIHAAMAYMPSICANWTMLAAWVKRRQHWLRSIEPRRQCVWNIKMETLLNA